jgi:hypothetical protein
VECVRKFDWNEYKILIGGMTVEWFHIEAEQQGLDVAWTDNIRSFLISSLSEMPKRSSSFKQSKESAQTKQENLQRGLEQKRGREEPRSPRVYR